MKIIWTIAAVALTAATTARAQSSVTLYGVIDEAFEAVSNARSGATGHALYQLNGSSGLQGSRWGLRGAEDLGGGLQAIFILENGFEPSNGRLNQGGDLFGRQAFVGLSSAALGTLTFGRQYDNVVDYLGPLGAAQQWGSNRSAHGADVDNVNNSYRVNNSVKFQSIDYAGFKFGSLYGFGGVAGSFAQNQAYSVGASYARGPLTLAAAYLNVRNPNISFFGNNATSGGVGTNNLGAANSIYGGYASASTYQVIGAAGSYAIAAATIGAMFTSTQFRGLGNVGASAPNPLAYTGTVVLNNYEVNARYQFTPSLLAGVAYNFLQNKGATSSNAAINASGGHYNQFSLGVDYFLSKSFDIYAVGAYQIASGYSSLGVPATAELGSLSASADSRQAVLRLGLRKRF